MHQRRVPVHLADGQPLSKTSGVTGSREYRSFPVQRGVPVRSKSWLSVGWLAMAKQSWTVHGHSPLRAVTTATGCRRSDGETFFLVCSHTHWRKHSWTRTRSAGSGQTCTLGVRVLERRIARQRQQDRRASTMVVKGKKGKGKKGTGRGTCLSGVKEGRMYGRPLFPQDVTMSDFFLQNGPFARAVCRSPSAQEAHDGPEKELVWKRCGVWLCKTVTAIALNALLRLRTCRRLRYRTWDVWQRRG